MRQLVMLVHLNAFVNVTPLVGGYLKAYAFAHPDIRSNWEIELYNTHCYVPASKIIADLVKRAPDVIGFSAYVWNIRLVGRLLHALRGILPPSTQFLLGGVEVANCGQDYLHPGWENVAVCNGEGEKTFRDYLLQLGNERPRVEQVKGISCYRNGIWLTNEPHDRIKDFSELPSPWLGGMFEPTDMSEMVLFETNRGCPFACEFCYWGGAVGSRVNKMDIERVKSELTYIARNKSKGIYLCDANFGMVPRDLEYAEHIAALNREYRFPSRVAYNSSKNNARRVTRIAQIFADAGLLSSQPISLQSVDDRTLKLAKRNNIKKDVYFELLRELNRKGIPTFVELLWPLPGETLDSFEAGVNELCRIGVPAFNIYPLIWLNNIGYVEKTEELGVATLEENDLAGRSRLVVKTNEVAYPDYVRGLQFSTAVLILYSCRGLYLTVNLLDHFGIARFRDVFDAFVDWMEQAPENNELVRIWKNGSEHFEAMCHATWYGEVVDKVLSSHRGDCDELIHRFAAAQTQWYEGAGAVHTGLLAAAVELDLLNRPYPYVQTKFGIDLDLAHIRIEGRPRALYQLSLPYDFPRMLKKIHTGAQLTAEDLAARPMTVAVNHRQGLAFYSNKWTQDEMYRSTYHLVREIRQIEARYEAWSPAEAQSV